MGRSVVHGVMLAASICIDLQCLVTCCQVLYSEDGLAILEGLNNDAPVGASLRFVSGASG